MNVYSLCIPRKSVRRNGIRTPCRRTLGTVPCHRQILKQEKNKNYTSLLFFNTIIILIVIDKLQFSRH